MINEEVSKQNDLQKTLSPVEVDMKKAKIQERENKQEQKVQLPIQWREEIYMVKDKVVEEIDLVFNEVMKVDNVADEKVQAKINQIKLHFNKRLKGFYNHILLTLQNSIEYVSFDIDRNNKNACLFTNKNLSLEDKNKESLNQFRDIINKTNGVKEKVIGEFQQRLDKELLQLRTQQEQKSQQQSLQQQQQQQVEGKSQTGNQTLNSQQQQQIANKQKIKIKDDKGQEKEVDLNQCVKICIDQYQSNLSKDIDRVKSLQPELKEQLSSFHINTRQHLKKTIDFQYAIESIKNQKDNNPFSLPSIPDDLFN